MPQCPAPRPFSVAVKDEATTQTDKNQLPFSGDHRCERRRMRSARSRFAAHPAPTLLPLRPAEQGLQITRLRTHSTSTSAAMTTAKMVMSTSATRSQ